ncbi:MAG: hypothetical protein ACLVF2_10165, partial [Faecalibacterium sp.]|uniref:hypothetical protein n=1 Tax=Faecalibacterium sp. TaxID=1971605 RepID=UPI0039997BED
GPSRIKGKWFGFGLLYCTKNPRHTFVCRGFFLCDRENSNSNDDDRSLRLKQGGVVGAAF